MKHITSRAFKARCLAQMKQVQTTGKPLLITLRGTAFKIVPVRAHKNDIFGFMVGKARIFGDLESPVWPSSKSLVHNL